MLKREFGKVGVRCPSHSILVQGRAETDTQEPYVQEKQSMGQANWKDKGLFTPCGLRNCAIPRCQHTTQEQSAGRSRKEARGVEGKRETDRESPFHHISWKQSCLTASKPLLHPFFLHFFFFLFSGFPKAPGGFFFSPKLSSSIRWSESLLIMSQPKCWDI